ncbi:unnamed protein product [Prorocentrum cordatum]|uniref:Uncharacterized protein n=1 Tax=Prorocentrum cordatum TaxID=2364126 RepID=A0ABN9W3X1_9DINO|nr:unnamed protein product [Polarella glacialis]
MGSHGWAPRQACELGSLARNKGAAADTQLRGRTPRFQRGRIVTHLAAAQRWATFARLGCQGCKGALLLVEDDEVHLLIPLEASDDDLYIVHPQQEGTDRFGIDAAAVKSWTEAATEEMTLPIRLRGVPRPADGGAFGRGAAARGAGPSAGKGPPVET